MAQPTSQVLRLSRAEREALLHRARGGTPARPGAERVSRRPTDVQASFGQEQLWVLDQLSPGRPRYNVPFTFEFEGEIDAGQLEVALNDLAERHESLRTTLVYAEGGLRQHIAEPSPQPLARLDVSAEPDPDTEARSRAVELTLRPFKLDEGPLWHATLIRKNAAGTRHTLVLAASHAVMDGWSVGLFLEELATAYDRRAAADPQPWAPPQAHFADFAAWQREQYGTSRITAMIDYWCEQLQDLTPLAFPRSRAGSGQGATRRFPIDAALVAAAAEVAANLAATPFVVYLAAYYILLAIHSGSRDVCVGTVVGGRTQPRFERVIGSCVNTVVVRLNVGAQDTGPAEYTGLDVVQQVRRNAYEAMSRQDLPFGKLVEMLSPEREGSANPLIRTVFTYGATPMAAGLTSFGSATARAVGISNGTVRFDYELAVEPDGDAWVGRLEHDSGLLPPAAAAELCRQYLAVLRRLVSALDAPLSGYTDIVAPLDLAVDAPRQTGETRRASADTEEAVMRLWAELLEVAAVDPEKDFFVLGGHSMLAAEMTRRISADYDIEIGLGEFFENCTVSGLAAMIAARRPTGTADLADLLTRIELMSDSEVASRLADLTD
jgi:Condensation domain/Phosphopantetheine attachment site